MKLILVGCEYSGTTTLAFKVREWVHEVIGGYVNLVHDHFKIPFTIEHSPEYAPSPEITPEEQAQYLALSPRIKDSVQRHNVMYHLGGFSHQDDRIVIGLHIEDAIYGPLYFGYGGDGSRKKFAQSIDRKIMEVAPETVLGLVQASPDVIARRMGETPRENGVLREKDIKQVVDAFAREHGESRIRHKIALDTSEASVDETMKDFVRQIEAHLTDHDRTRIIIRQAEQRDSVLTKAQR